MKPLLIISLLLLIFSSCSTYTKVHSDYDRSTDFSNYKSFAWLPDKADTTNSPYNNEIIRNNIRNYFGKCMSDRGYAFNAEAPDMLMQLVITNAKKTVERTYNPRPSIYYYRPYYFGSVYYQPYHGGYFYRYYPEYYYTPSLLAQGVTTTQAIDYVNGAITLNLIDRKQNKLVWAGTAEGDIYDPSVISKDLHPAVHRILAQYPVKPFADRKHRIK
jgi:hypothetical protein